MRIASFEPVEHFGITDPNNGMVCMEWGSERVWFYYHSPEAIDQGEIKPRESTEDTDDE